MAVAGRVRGAVTRAASGTRRGLVAAVGAAAAAAAAVGKGVGMGAAYLGAGAKAAYKKAASQTRKAYAGLRALSVARKTKDLFAGKVQLTNAERAIASARGMNPNGTNARKLIAERRAAAAKRNGNKPLVRVGGLIAKAKSLTRKAAAGAAAAAGVVAGAARAVGSKGKNFFLGRATDSGKRRGFLGTFRNRVAGAAGAVRGLFNRRSYENKQLNAERERLHPSSGILKRLGRAIARGTRGAASAARRAASAARRGVGAAARGLKHGVLGLGSALRALPARARSAASRRAAASLIRRASAANPGELVGAPSNVLRSASAAARSARPRAADGGSTN